MLRVLCATMSFGHDAPTLGENGRRVKSMRPKARYDMVLSFPVTRKQALTLDPGAQVRKRRLRRTP